MIEPIPNRVYNAVEFREQTCLFIVYAWFREEKCLYIGQTTCGWKRFDKHHAIGKKLRIEDADIFKFWNCKNYTELKELEAWLIGKYRPLLNATTPADHITDRENRRQCRNPKCNSPFLQAREWQYYCCDTCRNTHLRERRAEMHKKPLVCRDETCKKEYFMNESLVGKEWNYLCHECREKQEKLSEQLMKERYKQPEQPNITGA